MTNVELYHDPHAKTLSKLLCVASLRCYNEPPLVATGWGNQWLHYHWCDLIMVKSLVVGQRKFTYLKKNKDVPNVAHDSNL